MKKSSAYTWVCGNKWYICQGILAADAGNDVNIYFTHKSHDRFVLKSTTQRPKKSWTVFCPNIKSFISYIEGITFEHSLWLHSSWSSCCCSAALVADGTQSGVKCLFVKSFPLERKLTEPCFLFMSVFYKDLAGICHVCNITVKTLWLVCQPDPVLTGTSLHPILSLSLSFPYSSNLHPFYHTLQALFLSGDSHLCFLSDTNQALMWTHLIQLCRVTQHLNPALQFANQQVCGWWSEYVTSTHKRPKYARILFKLQLSI